MTLPGVEIITDDARPPAGPRLRLATPFLVGELQRGPEEAILVRGLRDVERLTGVRTTDSAPMYDWLDAYFREGGGVAYITPLRGPSAAAASHAFVDGVPTTAITVTAKEKGSWGNGASGGLSADIDVSGGNFEVKIYLNGVLVETSGMVADGAAAATWSTGSRYVTITDGPGVDPVATGSPANLTGGADDYGSISQTQIDTALALFTKDLGPGSYVLPGRANNSTAALALAAAAADRNRIARCDFPDTATVATITAYAATLAAGGNGDRIDLIGPRLTIPGLTASTTRTVEGSALRCAAEARNDQAGISPNQPAAGRWGAAQYARAATIAWTSDDDLETLNDAGCNVIRTVDGSLKVYGARTLADTDTDPAGIRLGSARLRMAITEIGRFYAEQITFAEIDQGGVVLGDLVGVIRGGISTYANSLFDLQVDAELVADENVVGTYYVEITIEFQAAPDAERVRVIITRAVTQV